MLSHRKYAPIVQISTDCKPPSLSHLRRRFKKKSHPGDTSIRPELSHFNCSPSRAGACPGLSNFYILPSPPWAERVPHLWLDTGGGTESIALSPGERVSRSGASTSRSGTGEGSLAQFREPTSSVVPRSSTAVQSNSTPQPGFAGETSGEPLPSASGRATRTMSRFELRLGCAARGGPHGQRETRAEAEL